jgi:lipopolysaccharide transport system permease protein
LDNDLDAGHLSRPIKVIRPPVLSASLIFSSVKTLLLYADLLHTFTMLRLTVRYKQSVLGWIWAALQPLALMIVYTVIFSRVAKVSSDGTPYPVFVLTGLLPWALFSSAITTATAGLTNYSHLVTKVYFPREIIPLSYVAAAVVDFILASFLLGGFMIYYKAPVTWNVLYAVPIIGLLTAFTTAVALVFSALNVRLRDVSMAMPLFLQVWMWTTPTAYSLQSVPAEMRRIYLANPLAALIESFRCVVLRGDSPDAGTVTLAGAITLISLVAAYAGFKKLEATMADFI